ncbi:hypothetical protein RI129_001403 [Pyrocoelia pectoralis]|uniref:Major facilitator superfamily (MFS) profile domain-containing protein n=1 Tax=Pyrocoelia pectoralis TaxID=417401 RepID=A0AAN7VY49_9COLE
MPVKIEETAFQEPPANAVQDEHNENDTPANHESAVKASSFGTYNVLLILSMLPASFSTLFSTTSMSYVFPIAQCDLNLNVDDKGLLNSVTYIGMFISGFFWALLTDLLGRRKLLMCVFLLEGIMVVLTGFSQKFVYLVTTKFLEGFVVTGGVSTVLTYTNEFHSAYHRTFIPLISGIYSHLAGIVLPLLGWIVFSDTVNIPLFNDVVLLRSWNIFLFVTAIPSFLAFFLYTILPESPKFLMMVGKREDALKVFRAMFRYNTKNSKDQYPIRALVDESKLNENNQHGGKITPNRTNAQALKEGWQQIQPLFYPPFLLNILIVITINFGLLMGLNTIRLWTPQLFIALNDHESVNEQNGFDLCGALLKISNDGQSGNETCFVNYDNGRVYLNNILVGTAAIVMTLGSFPLMGKLRKKTILCGAGIISGLCGILIYFSTNIIMAIALISINIGCTYIAMNVLLSIVIDLFPTSLRTTSVSLTMLFGRIGSSIGNLIFPRLVTSGCLYPFLTLGCVAADNQKPTISKETPANYEEAITAVGFGRYNVMLILTLIPSAFATSFSTSAMSYVFPIAQCDLNLTLDNKGMLNSVTYFGMLSSGFLSGFLTDTLGRKKLMIYVFILDGFVVILCAFSQSFTYLTIVKFFEGFIENGGFAAVIAYTSEFHTAKYRPVIPLFNGVFVNSGAIVLPLLSWIIFSDAINISLFSDILGEYVLRSWNIFILLTAIPSFMAGLMYILLPESPKFLMTVGNNEKALKTFKQIYKCNKGNSKNNTLRLWLPQLFAAINDRRETISDGSFDLCRTLQTLTPNSTINNETCLVNYHNDDVYINNIICAAIAVVVLLFSIPLIRMLGKKVVLCGSATMSGLCLIIISYYGNHIAVTITLSALHIGFNYVAFNSLLSSIVDLFPTTLR